MENLTVKSKSLNTQAEFNGQGLRINVNFTEDAFSKTLLSLNGKIYHAEDSTFAGNFNGQVNDGEMEYNMSGVKSKDMEAVLTAIADIEAQIRADEQSGNGEN